MKISVIVPVYNVEKYLALCLESIRNQRLEDFEVLMIDDGSTDHSTDICLSYEKNDSRFRYLHQKNGGLSAARNHGIREAKGDYVCFVDSDDIVDSRYLEILYENIIAFHADLSFGYFKKFYDEVEEHELVNHPKRLSRQEAYRRLTVVGENYESTNLIVAWNKLIRRDIIKDVSFLPGKWHEDEFWIHHIIEKSPVIIETKAEIYYYRQRRDSIVGSSNQTDLRHLDIVDAFEDRVKLYKKHVPRRLYREMVYAYRNTIAIQYRTDWKISSKEKEKKIRGALKRRFYISFQKYPVPLSLSHIKHSMVFALNINIHRQRWWKHKCR